MALGFAFLRPQGLKASPGKAGFRASELLGDFLDALVKDPDGAAALGAAIADAGKDVLPRFLAERQEPLRKAEGKLRALFKPFSSLLMDFLKGMKGSIPDTLPAAIKAMQGVIALIRAESAARMLRELIHLARTDLQVTPAAIEAVFRAWVDGAVSRLQVPVLAGDLSEAALNRYEWGVHLKSLELLILEEIDWPSLDDEVIFGAIKDLYAHTGFEKLLDKFGKVLDSAGDLSGPLAKLLDKVLPPPAATSGSVGAAGDLPPVAPGAPLCHYASWVLEDNVHFEVKTDTETITPITWITYKSATPHQMEQLTLHITWISDLSGFILHFISQELGDRGSNLCNMGWDATDLLMTVAGKRIHTGWQWLGTLGVNLLACWERNRCGAKDVVYPLTLIAADLGETILYRRWRFLVKESLLSFVTLLNHDPAARRKWESEGSRERVEYDSGGKHESLPVAFNNDQFHGFAYLFGEIGTILLPAILSRSDKLNYGFGGGGLPGGLFLKMLGGWCLSLVGHYCGLLMCKLAAGEGPADTVAAIVVPLRERYVAKPDSAGGWKALRIVHGVFVGFAFEALLMQLIYRYLWSNNNTESGTFTGLDRREDLKLPGYPDDHLDSPYKLPWVKGEEHECVQNAMGIWSHFPGNQQTYAIDWNHNAGTDVLNSREGIITSLDQSIPNHDRRSANAIEVMALKTVPAGTAGALPGVEKGPSVGVAFKDTSIIPNGTLFPPYWDVNGNQWQLFPSDMPLHPSGCILGGAPPPAGGLPPGTMFQFLDAKHDRGMAGKAYPAGAKFDDGSTPIPAGVVFAPDVPSPPPKWAPMYRPGTMFTPWRANLSVIPFDLPSPTPATPYIAGFTTAAGDTFLDGAPIPPDLEMPIDCQATPAWLPKPHPVTPMYLKGTLFKKVAGSDYFNTGTEYVAADTPFPDAIPPADPEHPNAELSYQWCVPVVAVFVDYAHALAGFTSVPKATYDKTVTPAVVRPLVPPEKRVADPYEPDHPLTDVFGTADPDEILGRYVPQGRVIMLSGDTGISAYNHMHQDVGPKSQGTGTWRDRQHTDSSLDEGFTLTFPFVFADVKHTVDNGFREAPMRDGIPHAMTWYISQNERNGP